MASVIRKTANPDTLQYTYLHSVNSPDYDPEYWVHNPNVQSLINDSIPTRYWKVEEYYGDSTTEVLYRVVEMTSEEKASVEAAVPAPQPQPVALSNEFRDKQGKLRVHQTSRHPGLGMHWTGRGDDRSNPYNFGTGEEIIFTHNIGDSTSHTVYVDFNGLLNETWMHEVILTWSGAYHDTVVVDVVPDTCSIMAASGTYLTTYGPLVVPTTPGTGNIDFASDVLAYTGGLVQRDNPTDETITPGPAFWDADWNVETNRFENLTPNIYGQGGYNIFHTEVPLARIFNHIHLLKDGFQIFNSSDTDQVTHGYRLRVQFITRMPDHEWSLTGIIVMHRKYMFLDLDNNFSAGE